MNKQSYVPLLMTASVSTRGMKGACFSDEEREQMYVEALSFYIRELLREDNQQTIVFAENSGWPLEALRKKLPDYPLNRIEFISLNPKDFDISQGKGYNEMLMINQVVAQSQCIQQVGSFFKVTGRYPIYNIVYFLRQANHHLHDKNCALYCDTKDHKLYDWLHLGWNGHSFECRLFGAKKDWYLTHMAPAYVLCNDYNGNCMESVIFSLLTTYRGGQNVITRFRREPHFGGLEGSNVSAFIFSKQQDSWKGKLKRLVGNAIRILMPWFKF